MNPVTEMAQEHLDYWAEFPNQVATFTAPSDPPGCVPCRAVVTETEEDGRRFNVVRVPWKPDEIELAHLAQGGTIWLSTWGGLPPHSLEVQAPT